MERDPDKTRAWQQRSRPLARGRGPNRTGRLNRGTKPLPQRSPTLAAYYRDVRAPLVADLIARVGYCQVRVALALVGETAGDCAGPLTVHERRRRGQGGSLENPANLIVACAGHNSAAGNASRGDVFHRNGIVVFEGDPGWEALGARRGERKQRAAS